MKANKLVLVLVFAAGCVPGEAPVAPPEASVAESRRTTGAPVASGETPTLRVDAEAPRAQPSAVVASVEPESKQPPIVVDADAVTELTMTPRELAVKTPEPQAKVTVKADDGGGRVEAKVGEVVPVTPDTTLVVTVTSAADEVVSETTVTTPAAEVAIESAAVDVEGDGRASVVVETSSENPPHTPIVLVVTGRDDGAVTYVDPVTDAVVSEPAAALPAPTSASASTGTSTSASTVASASTSSSTPTSTRTGEGDGGGEGSGTVAVPLEVIAEILEVAPDEVPAAAEIAVVAVNQAGEVTPPSPPVVLEPAEPDTDEIAALKARLKEIRKELAKLKKKEGEPRAALLAERREILERLKKLKASRSLSKKLKKRGKSGR